MQPTDRRLVSQVNGVETLGFGQSCDVCARAQRNDANRAELPRGRAGGGYIMREKTNHARGKRKSRTDGGRQTFGKHQRKNRDKKVGCQTIPPDKLASR